jgi:molecular chaperone GrpE (heat shock protein)
MIGRSLVDELSEDREQDEKIIKSFYAKDTLSQNIFQGTKMIDSVRDRLLSIADNFYDFLGVDFFIHDVVLTGSLANYNWSEFSDIDLHVIVDYEESGHRQDLLKEFFNAKRAVWNISHDIKIKNYEVELYVQDIKEKHISSGVYSVLNNKWIIEPQKEKKEIDDRKILEKGEEYAKLINKLTKETKKGKNVGDEIDDVKKKIKRFRQTGLEDGGEYSYENLTFKLLRRNGYIEKLINLKKDVKDKEYSINESVEFSYKDILRVEKEALKFYGSSHSFNRAVGFISPNGYLLDFGEGTGVRGQDHRNIGYVLDLLPNIDLGEYGTDKWKHETSWGLYAVMDMGFIRYLPESQGIDMHQMPTQEQFDRIRQLIQKYNGRIIVEMNEDAYVEYEPNTPEDYIIDGIKKYYNERIKPRPFDEIEDEEMFLDRE